MSTTDQKYGMLRQMADNAGKNLHARVTLAQEILADKDWVRAKDKGGGDEFIALGRLEACFGDLCGAVTLTQMLDVLREVPDLKDWAKHKYNIAAIWAERQAARTPAKTNGRKPATRAPSGLTPQAQFGELTPARANKEYERAVAVVKAKDATIEQLKAQLATANATIDRLKNELAGLKKKARELLSA